MGLNGRPWIYTCLAYDGERLVGQKVGRSDDPCAFESWYGGVLTAFRRRGSPESSQPGRRPGAGQTNSV